MAQDNMREEGKEENIPAEYSVFDSLKHPVCIIGTDGTLLHMNHAYRELFAPEGANIHMSWDHPLYPEYRRQVAQAYINALSGSERQCFAAIRTSDDTQVIAEIHLFPIFKQDQVDSILAHFRIVTDRLLSFDRSTLSLISEDNFQYDTLHFEFSPIPLIRINTEYEIIRCSRSMEGLLGYSAEEIIDRKMISLDDLFVFDGEKVRKICSEILHGEVPFKRIGEVKIRSRSEETRMVNVTLYPLIQNTEIISVEIAMEDISRIFELRQKLSTQSSGELFMDITKGFLHSLNNSINVILSRTQLLMQITEKDSVTRGIQMIEESSLDIVKQIRRVQDFIGTREESREETSEALVNIIEDAIEFSRMRFKVEDTEKRRNIVIEKRYFTAVHVKTDTRLLREIMVSLILSVSTFIQKKGTIQIQLKENHDITLSVRATKDTAPEGTPPGKTHPLLTSGDIRKGAERINLKIIEEESAEFYTLRAVFPARMVIPSVQQEQKEPEYRIRDLDILVAEDEVALQRVLYELFDRMGNRVMVCSSGSEALSEFKRKKYDLVITDYDIAGITGIELSARVKELNEDTMTVLLSGWMINNVGTYKNVIDLFLPKPFKLDELIRRISRTLKEKKK